MQIENHEILPIGKEILSLAYNMCLSDKSFIWWLSFPIWMNDDYNSVNRGVLPGKVIHDTLQHQHWQHLVIIFL